MWLVYLLYGTYKEEDTTLSVVYWWYIALLQGQVINTSNVENICNQWEVLYH